MSFICDEIIENKTTFPELNKNTDFYKCLNLAIAIHCEVSAILTKWNTKKVMTINNQLLCKGRDVSRKFDKALKRCSVDPFPLIPCLLSGYSCREEREKQSKYKVTRSCIRNIVSTDTERMHKGKYIFLVVTWANFVTIAKLTY